MQPNVGTGLGWMAWTWQTAAFFGVIALLLVIMAIWEWRVPGGAPRRGVLGPAHHARRSPVHLAVVGRLPAPAVAGAGAGAGVGRHDRVGGAGAADLPLRLSRPRGRAAWD